MAKTDNTMPLEVAQPAACFSNPVAAGATIRGGALVALNAAGDAIPAAPGAAVIRGIAREPVDNSGGAAGAARCNTLRGVWLLKANGLTRAHIGKPVYVVDDQTVGATGDLIAGRCLDITTGGAAVEIL